MECNNNSWIFFPSAHALIGYLKITWRLNNETVSRQNLCAGNIAKSMTSEGNSVLLPTNVYRSRDLFS